MLRWAIRAAASYKSEVIRESGQATRKSKNAMTKFSRAQREKDMDKKWTTCLKV